MGQHVAIAVAVCVRCDLLLQVLDVGVEITHLRLEAATRTSLVCEHLVKRFERHAGVADDQVRRLA